MKDGPATPPQCSSEVTDGQQSDFGAIWSDYPNAVMMVSQVTLHHADVGKAWNHLQGTPRIDHAQFLLDSLTPKIKMESGDLAQ